MLQPREKKKSVSVVIPNYNGEALLRQNLPLLYRALTTAGLEFEVIIPDDASTDGSLAFLRHHYPDIRVLAHPRNQGFAANINAGIRQARRDLVLLLNSDIALPPDYFTFLLPYFDDPNTFGVSGRIIALDSDQIQDGAKYPDYRFGAIGATLNFIPEGAAPRGKKMPTFFMSGANILADRAKLAVLGGFNELFSPFYSEDAELGLRAWRLGYACYYEHRAICRHPNSVTIKKYNSQRRIRIIAKRNKFYLHYLHLQGWELAWWFVLLALKTLGRLLVLDRPHLQSVKLFFQTLPAIRQAKKDFAALQRRYGATRTVRDVRNLILDQLAGLPIRKF
jgi:GT2 family glycosyltransferase